MATFNKRFNAQRAAKTALGKTAEEGKQFTTEKNAAGEWVWAAIQPIATPIVCDITPPDFTAKTHERFRPKLAAVVAMVEARDIDGLRAFHINPSSTSPKAIMRYRDKALASLSPASNRPGDAAAIYAAETGVSYDRALVACNMD